MTTIHDDPKYLEIKNRLDDVIREYAQFATEWARDHYIDGSTPDTLMASGWILAIAVTGLDDGEEVDDLLHETSGGMNNYMAVGIAKVTTKYWTDVALGKFMDDEEDD